MRNSYDVFKGIKRFSIFKFRNNFTVFLSITHIFHNSYSIAFVLRFCNANANCLNSINQSAHFNWKIK